VGIMKLHKKVNLSGWFVNAYVYRDGVEIASDFFSLNMFACCFFRSMFPKAIEKAYGKANKWADQIIEVELKADHGGE
jgi:hypothetical protein